MLAPDVNVVIDAFRSDAPRHDVVRAWLVRTVAEDVAIALFEPVLFGFLRVTTHPKLFSPPTPLAAALTFVEELRRLPNAVTLRAGERHFAIFEKLCRDADARGSLVADAYLAALAIEHGCTWITNDRDYSRFERLDWRVPG